MTILCQNSCYNEVCYQGTALFLEISKFMFGSAVAQW